MYEVIRTYCTSHPVISTRQGENSISEAQNTRCMLLWAYAFFDWRNEHKRNACGYSQSRLAKELHISRQNLNEIENGKTRASKEMKHTLLHYLDYCKCTQPFTLNVDYLRVRFPTTDALAIIKDVLAMKIEYFVHEDYGLFGYEELYRYG